MSTRSIQWEVLDRCPDALRLCFLFAEATPSLSSSLTPMPEEEEEEATTEAAEETDTVEVTDTAGKLRCRPSLNTPPGLCAQTGPMLTFFSQGATLLTPRTTTDETTEALTDETTEVTIDETTEGTTEGTRGPGTTTDGTSDPGTTTGTLRSLTIYIYIYSPSRTAY